MAELQHGGIVGAVAERDGLVLRDAVVGKRRLDAGRLAAVGGHDVAEDVAPAGDDGVGQSRAQGVVLLGGHEGAELVDGLLEKLVRVCLGVLERDHVLEREHALAVPAGIGALPVEHKDVKAALVVQCHHAL